MKTYHRSWAFAGGLGLVLTLLWIVGLHPQPGRAAELCVSNVVSGCYASIQQAVDASGEGDTILVAQGVYFEAVVISHSLTLEGGWDDSFTGRDWDAYVTTIDADGNGPVIRTVPPASGSAITVTIDGFTLVHGDDSTSLGWGGGLRLQDNYNGISHFVVRHNVISNNIACQLPTCQGWGGGIVVYGGSAIIEDNFIGNNIANWEGGGRGGGISISGYAEVMIQRNTIIANTAVFSTTGLWDGKGGGLEMEHAGEATVRDNEIRGNVAALNGTGRGGGVFANGRFDNNLIVGNTASLNHTGYGGGVYAYYVAEFSHNTVESNFASQHGDGTGGGMCVIYMQKAGFNTISGNEASRGGGVFFNTYSGNQAFFQNMVANNRATGMLDTPQDGGGGISSYADWVEITGNTILSNTAYYGGGVQILAGDQYRLQDNQIGFNTGSAGGGISVQDATGKIVANTIYSNTALVGGGMYLIKAATPAVERNMILNNRAEGFYAGGGGILASLNDDATVYLTNNLIAGNAVGTGGRGGGVDCWRGSCVLINNTIVDNNRGDHQEGVVLGSTVYSANLTLRNNIVVGHSTGVDVVSGVATSDYNDYFDNVVNMNGVAPGVHDRIDDPQFVNRPGEDYHLGLGSPLIDKADAGLGILIDIDGDPRPHGAGVDIGADEAYRTETYVSQQTGHDGTGDGSPVNPYATVPKGLAETQTGGSVYVGRGQYIGLVDIERSVSLLGGYNESDWSRDIPLYETVLDAQGLSSVVFIASEGVQVLLEGFTITGGEADVFGIGGGILVIDNAAATIRLNTISGNHASNGGGGVVIWGDEYRQSILDSNRIFGNSSDGVFTPLAEVSLARPDQGPEPGGGVLVNTPARVMNNMIFDNSAGAGGDGIAVGGAPASIQVWHNTIVGNGDSDGQAVYILGISSNIEFFNNLVVGHGIGITATLPTQVRWDANAFDGNGSDYAPGLLGGAHDVSGDPYFVDPAGGDYHIGPASVAAGHAIELGVLVDFDGDPRPAPPDSTPDIGADEITQRWLYLPLIRR